MGRTQEDIKVDPHKVLFAQVQTDCIEVEAETGTNLGGKYWIFSSSSEDFYVWYDVDNASTDPAVAGKTEIEVNISAGDLKKDVALAVVAAINAVSGLKAIVDPKNSGRVILKVLEYAAGTPAANGNLTGHSFQSVHVGFSHDFGFTDGDIEPTLDQQLLDITAHQSGTEILTSIVTGMNAEFSISLKQYSDDNLKRLVEDTTGGAYTPSGGTKIQGYGSGQNFKSVLEKAGRLILHPVAVLDSDKSKDVCFWLAYPKMDSITFSGENPTLVNVTFRVFRDEFINSVADKVAFGDHTQE